MFSHMMVGSNDIGRSKIFYDALFAAIGARLGVYDEKGRLLYMHRGAAFMVTTPLNGEPATHGNGSTIGFAVDGPAQADAWHAAGAEHGGTAVEDPPGVREAGLGALYLAYLRDPDGNKLCAVYRMPA
jgi:catechol 2,3-dioxygenase-like lactoylglutathione lyase family enzyme